MQLFLLSQLFFLPIISMIKFRSVMCGVYVKKFSLVTCIRDKTADAAATFSDSPDGTCDRKEASLHSSFPPDR